MHLCSFYNKLMDAKFQSRGLKNDIGNFSKQYLIFQQEWMVYISIYFSRKPKQQEQQEIMQKCPAAAALRKLSRIIQENQNRPTEQEIEGSAKETINQIVKQLRGWLRMLGKHDKLCPPCKTLSKQFYEFSGHVLELNKILLQPKIQRQFERRLRQIKPTVEHFKQDWDCRQLQQQSEQSTNNARLQRLWPLGDKVYRNSQEIS